MKKYYFHKENLFYYKKIMVFLKIDAAFKAVLCQPIVIIKLHIFNLLNSPFLQVIKL